MCIVHNIEDYLDDGGLDKLERTDIDALAEDKKKIALAKERLEKAHAYSDANTTTACEHGKYNLSQNESNRKSTDPAIPADTHPPHAAPCKHCAGADGKQKYHALDRDDLAVAVAAKYLEKIEAGGGEPLKAAMGTSGRASTMAGVLVCVDPTSGKLKVIKGHSGPGLGPDYADLDCYAPFLSRDAKDERALKEKRDAYAALPASGRFTKNELKAVNKTASDAESALLDDDPEMKRLDGLVTAAGAGKAGKEKKKAEKAKKKELKSEFSAARKNAFDAAAADDAVLADLDTDSAEVKATKALRRDFKAKKAAYEEAAAKKAEGDKLDAEVEELQKKFNVGNFKADDPKDEMTDISETCIDPKGKKKPIDGNCGVCAAPKLLMAAREHKLVPVSLAEFWVGADSPGEGWKQGEYIDSCAACMTIVGSMMCGIDEKNTALTPKMDAKIGA